MQPAFTFHFNLEKTSKWLSFLNEIRSDFYYYSFITHSSLDHILYATYLPANPITEYYHGFAMGTILIGI